jgi:hypothetical protein
VLSFTSTVVLQSWKLRLLYQKIEYIKFHWPIVNDWFFSSENNVTTMNDVVQITVATTHVNIMSSSCSFVLIHKWIAFCKTNNVMILIYIFKIWNLLLPDLDFEAFIKKISTIQDSILQWKTDYLCFHRTSSTITEQTSEESSLSIDSLTSYITESSSMDLSTDMSSMTTDLTISTTTREFIIFN